MPRFAANLSMLFTEVPFLERFDRAARAGFGSVEFLFPYAHTPGEVAAKLKGNRLSVVLHNLPAGDWDAGERGIACLPDRVDEFRDGVAQAIEYATALGAPQLNCLAGKVPLGASEDLLRKTFVANLQVRRGGAEEGEAEAADRADQHLRHPGLLPEPHGAGDLDHGRGGERPKADNLFLQYDIYHAQRSEGELAATMEKHLARIGHIQVADNPGRNEPGTGEIHYPFLFAHLDRLGYKGHIGCEYKPKNGTEAGLAWLEHARRQLRPVR